MWAAAATTQQSAEADDIVIFVVLLLCVSFHCNSIKLSIKITSKSREYNKLID